MKSQSWPVVAVIASAAATLSAIAPQSRPQAPVFRSGVDRVAVDFLAIAPDGAPVSDLRLGEIALTVDGKSREVRSLEFLRLAPVSLSLPSTLPPAEALPAPFGSNAPAEAGRAIILVFHHTSMLPGDERLAKESAASFIKTLTPRDRLALVTFQEGGVVVDLTTHHARVLKALPSITGHAPAPDVFIPASTAAAKANETAFALRNLASLLNSFAAIDGPKTVVFISNGLPPLSRDTMIDYPEVGKAAAKVGAQLFIIKPHSFGAMGANINHPTVEDGLSNNGLTSGVGGGLEEFAGVTGGALFQLSATATQAFERVNLESSAHYLLSFDAEPAERNGKSHKIALTTTRPRVSIRARPQFVIEADKMRAAPKTAAAGRPQTLLGDLRTYRDLPLRAVAYTFRSTDPRQVLVLASMQSSSGSKLTAASFALIDSKGGVVTQWDADADDLSKRPVVTAMTIASGSYRLRAAAEDADGRQGAVDYEFSATLTKAEPLTLGALMIGHQQGEDFRPQMDFGDEPSATAYLEVYGRPPTGKTATVTMELAPTVDGPAFRSVPAAITATRQADRFIATAELPIAALGPGDVIVRAVARVGDAVVGTVTRTLRKNR